MRSILRRSMFAVPATCLILLLLVRAGEERTIEAASVRPTDRLLPATGPGGAGSPPAGEPADAAAGQVEIAPPASLEALEYPPEPEPGAGEDDTVDVHSEAVAGRWSERVLIQIRHDLFEGEDPDRRRVALWALARAPDPVALDWALELAHGPGADELRFQAIQVLGRRPEAEVLGLLEAELHGRDPVAVAGAVVAILDRAERDPAALALASACRVDPRTAPYVEAVEATIRRTEARR